MGFHSPLLYLAVALVFGLTAATIALSKGRSPRAWFVTGILAGPLGFAIVLLADKHTSLPT
jgi:VIT1/CCC1 family predicted Fe2+/Mn2+ transporter